VGRVLVEVEAEAITSAKRGLATRVSDLRSVGGIGAVADVADVRIVARIGCTNGPVDSRIVASRTVASRKPAEIGAAHCAEEEDAPRTACGHNAHTIENTAESPVRR
jgi:hypothetical protein